MIKKLLLSLVMVFSISSVHADDVESAATTDEAEKPSIAAQFFDSEQISNLGKLDLDNPKLEMKAVENGRFQLNQDYVTNLIVQITGTEKLPEGFLADLRAQGFDKNVEQSFLFKWLDEARAYVLTWVFGIAGVWILCVINFRKMQGQKWDEIMNLLAFKLMIVLTLTGFLLFFKTLLVCFILTVNGYANKFLLTTIINQSAVNYSTVPSASDRYNVAANSNNFTETALSVLKTRQAKLFNNMGNIVDRDRWFVNFTGGYTLEEAFAKFNEFQALEVKAENDGSFNIDMTTSISNIVNLYKISRSVSISRLAGDYSNDEKKVYGSDSKYATLEINANAESFEKSSGTKVKDGLLIKQIQAVVDNSATNGTNIILSSANQASAILIPAFQSGNINSSTLYADAANYEGLEDLKTSIKSYAKKFAKQQVADFKVEDIGDTTPDSRIILSGLVTSAVMAGVQGADKSGAMTRNHLKYFLKIAEAEINKECTENWSEVKDNKVNVEKLNAARDQDAKTFFKNRMPSIAWKCAFIRENDNTVIAMGSEKPEDALMYKAQVMGYKAAYDFAVLAFMEGVKEYVNEDQTYLQAVVGTTLKNLQLGLVGYALDGSARARIQDSITKRDAFISNAIHFRVNENILKSPTKINTEDLFGSKTLEFDDEDSKRLATAFPKVDMQYAYLQSAVNLTANTPETESSLSDKISASMNAIMAEMVGIPTDSLKVMMRSDPNLSVFEGAKACLKDSLICYQRPKANLLAGTASMGGELISYTIKVFAINSALHLAADTVDGLADLAENLTNATAVVGEKQSMGGAVAKVLVGGSAKVVKFFVAATISVTEALKPIALIMGGAGVVMKFVLPMLPAFILTNIIITFLVNIVGFQDLLAPYYIFRMLIASDKEDFWNNFGALSKAAISLCILLAVYAFLTAFVYVAIDLIDVAPILWHVLGGSETGIIGSLMAAITGMIVIAFTLFSLIKNTYGVGEQLMQKFEYNSNVDREIDRVAKSLFDSRSVEAIRTLSKESNNFIDATRGERKRNNRQEAMDERKSIRTAAQKLGQGVKSSNDSDK